MSNVITKLIGEKRKWKAMEARAGQLPPDYRIVYTELKQYLWRFTAGDGMDIVEVLSDVLGRFEHEAAAGRPVLDVTGADVAAFGDGLLPGYSPRYLEKWRTALNSTVAEKLSP